jgi:hypothetical protein
MATLQSTTIPLELSDDGTTWRTLVCLKQYNMPLSKAVNSTETFCGVEVGLGAGTFNPTGTAVCKTDNSTSEWTYKELLIRWNAETSIWFRCTSPSGGSVNGAFFLKGQCKVTDLDLIFATGQTVEFSFTLTGEGTLNIAYP